MECEYHEEDYRQDVYDAAAEILRSAQESGEGHAAWCPDAQTWADNSRWTQYTGRARCVLYWSDNENAAFDGEEDWLSPCGSMGDIYRRAAEHAMRDDILDALHEMEEEEEEQ